MSSVFKDWGVFGCAQTVNRLRPWESGPLENEHKDVDE